MKKNSQITIYNYHLFILVLAVLGFSNMPLSAQLSIYSEHDFAGEVYQHPETSDLEITDTGITSPIGSMKLTKGYKVTLYKDANSSDPALIFYGGDYHELPQSLGTVRSYRLEHVDMGHKVEVFFGSPDIYGHLIDGLFHQELGTGVYDNSNLLTSVNNMLVDSFPLVLSSIAVPRGYIVQLHNPSNKSKTLINKDPNSNYQTYNIETFTDFIGNVSQLKIKKARYRIQSIELVSIKEQVDPIQKHLVSFENEEDQSIDYKTHEEVKESVSFFNGYNSTSLSLVKNANTKFSIKGIPLRTDNEAQNKNLIKQAVIDNVHTAITNGHTTTGYLEYNLAENCSGTCPPKSRCTNIIEIQPVNILYSYTASLIQIDENDKVIPSTEFKVNSAITIHESKFGQCIQNDPEPITEVGGNIGTGSLDQQVFFIQSNAPGAGGRVIDADWNKLGKNGSPIQLWDKNTSPHQNWKFVASDKGQDLYQILSMSPKAGKHKYIDALYDGLDKNGGGMQLWGNSVADNQLWRVTQNSNGTYRITSAHEKAQNRCIDADGYTYGKNGGKIQLWEAQSGNKNQEWNLLPLK